MWNDRSCLFRILPPITSFHIDCQGTNLTIENCFIVLAALLWKVSRETFLLRFFRRVALKYRGRDDSFPWITMSNKPARRRLVNSIIKVSRAPVGTWCTRWSSAGWRTCSSWRRRQPRCSSTQWSWRQRTSRWTKSFEGGNDMIRRTAVEKLNFSDRRGAKKKTARGTFLHNWHAIMRIPTNPLWR